MACIKVSYLYSIIKNHIWFQRLHPICIEMGRKPTKSNSISDLSGSLHFGFTTNSMGIHCHQHSYRIPLWLKNWISCHSDLCNHRHYNCTLPNEDISCILRRKVHSLHILLYTKRSPQSIENYDNFAAWYQIHQDLYWKS